MVELRRYTPIEAAAWDTFVDTSKNGTFLFKRGYMDYHAARFADYSLMVYSSKGTLLALLPANIAVDGTGAQVLQSHAGLTYGGFVLGTQATMDEVLEMFQATLAHLRENNIRAFYYKQVPVCYHLYPAQEDDYALWRLGAQLTATSISTTIALDARLPLQYRRRRGIARAMKRGYSVHTTTALETVWQMIEQNLRARHNTAPVHSLQEMQLLMARFPDNIKCYVAVRKGVAEGCVIVYLCRRVAHAQYIQSSPTGRADGAIDLLLATLIDTLAPHYTFFDLGISTEDGGQRLNSNLIAQKEGFGGRGITYKQWTFLI